MSSTEQSRVVLNLDSAPLGTVPPVEPTSAQAEAPQEAQAAPVSAPSASTVNVGKRTYVIKSVAANVPKTVERVVRPQSALPASPSVLRPRPPRRAPITPLARPRSVPATELAPQHQPRPEPQPVTQEQPTEQPQPTPQPTPPKPASVREPRSTPAPAPNPVPVPVPVRESAPKPAPVHEPASTRAPAPAPAPTPKPAPARDPDPTPSRYRTDPAAAARYASVVAEHVLAGRDPVPYLTEAATDGLAVEGLGGLAFSVTIPFALPPDLPAELRTALRESLTQLSASWSLNSDPRGETLRSPMLRDTEHTWAILPTLLDTVARHGGTSHPSASADIRIAPGVGEALTEPWRDAVARIVRGHWDVLRRLGANPRAVRTPDRATAAEPEQTADSLVFDFFDGSFSPGVVQAHVKLALAVAYAGFRHSGAASLPESDLPHDLVQRVRVPDGRLTPGAFTVYELDPESGTAAVTELLDVLFRRDIDIEQQLALAALNAWRRPTARAVLTDEGLGRVIALLPVDGPSQSFADGLGLLPAAIPVGLCEQHQDVRRAPTQFTRTPFRVLVGVVGEGDVAVYDGLEVTAAQFATLLRSTGWRPDPGLLFTFVRFDDPAAPPRASRRHPLPPPLPEDWPRLLGWARAVAGLLDTCVAVTVAANMNLLHVPGEVLDSYEAYGPAEAARLMRDWRTETQTSSIVLRHLPAHVLPADSDALPGPALVPLPERSDGPIALISTLREAMQGLEIAGTETAGTETAERQRHQQQQARQEQQQGRQQQAQQQPPTPGDDPAAADPAAAHPTPDPASEGYLQRPDLFDAVADRVAERLARGEAPLAYDLIGRADADGTAFGLELEFVFAGDEAERAAALMRLGEELASIRPGPWGLTAEPVADAAEGVVTLASPPLGDDVASWFNLEKVLAAIRRQGGVAAPGTTARMRIGLTGFAGGVGRYQALMTMVSVHHLVLHRLAGDPAGIVPTPAWRHPALNEPGIAIVPPWSGTLDAAILQVRLRIWLGVIGAARYLAGLPEFAGRLLDARPDAGHAAGIVQPVLYPRDRPLVSGRLAVYRPEPAAATLTARSLMDLALTGRADRERAAALYHITAWPEARSARVRVSWGEGWASFSQPSRALPPEVHRYDAELFGPATFTAELDLDAGRAVPVVHAPAGSAAIPPKHFALLLREVGRRPESPVALLIDPGPRRDLSELADWIRELTESLGAPVLLGMDGARLADLPDAALDGFALYAWAEEVPPGFDWEQAAPSEVWLVHPALPAPPSLIALPDPRSRTFAREASWQAVGSCVLFAAPAELGRHVRQAEALEQTGGLITAVFARSRGGVPQATVRGHERDLEPAELATVLFRYAGAAPGVELRLVVLDAIEPDDEAWCRWAALAAAHAGRIAHYAAPRTSVLMSESRIRGRLGGRAEDYRLAVPADADPAEPRWRSARPGPYAPPSAFTEDRGRLRPISEVPQEERWPARRS